MTYRQALWKRSIETALARPLVWLGKCFSRWLKPKVHTRLFIFCPWADIGGANLINVDIIRCLRHLHPVVIFSKQPRNNEFLHLFQMEGVTLWDLHARIDHKWMHFVNIFYRGVIAAWINKTKPVAVIGGESLYFHKVLPWIKKDIRTVELSHLGTWFNYTQAFVKDMDLRVFSTQRLQRDAEAFYRKQQIPEALHAHMTFVDSMIQIPETIQHQEHEKLQVVFIGRGNPQKRVHLIAEIAKRAHARQLPLHISFAGDVEQIVEPAQYPFCTFYGNVRDRKQLKQIQRQADVLLLTSAFEGLPVVVMEMMGEGKAIVSTAVNAIPDYIHDGINGLLIPDSSDEGAIVNDTLLALSMLSSDRDLVEKMGAANRAYAMEHFGEERFCREWGEVVRGGG